MQPAQVGMNTAREHPLVDIGRGDGQSRTPDEWLIAVASEHDGKCEGNLGWSVVWPY